MPWILVLVGPVGLVIFPQFLCRKALAKRGLPESLETARERLLALLMQVSITVSYRVNGERNIPLSAIVGDEVPGAMRRQNELRLEGYQKYRGGKLMLPIVYNMGPSFILGLAFVIANIVADPAAAGPREVADIQIARTLGSATLTVACSVVCVVIVIAYLRIVDVLDRAGFSGSAP